MGELTQEKDDALAAVKKSGLATLKSVKAFAGDALKCVISDTKDCSDREKKFIEKFKEKDASDIDKQITRLKKMMGGQMKEDLKMWIIARLHLLMQMKK